MCRLVLLLIISLASGCREEIKETSTAFQIMNEIMNYEVVLIRTCEQNYDDHFSKEDVPNGIFLESVPPFDTLPCITNVSVNKMVSYEYLNRQCIVLKLNNSLNDLAPYIETVTLARAKYFLDSMIVLHNDFDLTQLDLFKAGIEITYNPESCKNEFSGIYNFSNILLNHEKDKAVVFLYQQGHVDQKAAYFLKRIGNIWFLEIKELM